jgi:hypothetical protein
MVIISPTELRSEQKKYLDMAEKEDVVVKRGSKLIHLVVRERTITDEELKRGISAEELKKRMHKRIDKMFGE